MRTATQFGALAQATRLRLLTVLASRAPDGMAAGDIAEALQQAPSTLSFHLSVLEQAGLVGVTRKGRSLVYALRRGEFHTLLTFLGTLCSSGPPERFATLVAELAGTPPAETRVAPSFNVLFLCARNSARSLMAEALLTRMGRGCFHAYSAGSRPASAPMQEVLDRLARFGHDVDNLRPKSWNVFTSPTAPRMDFVITLCDPSDSEACPDFGPRAISANWPFPDPAKFNGSALERTALLNALYGMIRRRLEAFTRLPFHSLDRLSLQSRLDELGDVTRAA